MKSWKKLASKYIHRDKWLTVRADECETHDGISVSPYYVLEYADWVNITALDSENRVLVVNQYRHGIEKTCLELPCGVVEKGEKPEETARRELLEETGCSAESLELLGSLNPNSATHDNEVHCFLARNVKVTAEPSPDHTEDITFEFIPYQAVLKMIDTGEFNQAQHIASLMMGLRRAGLIE